LPVTAGFSVSAGPRPEAGTASNPPIFRGDPLTYINSLNGGEYAR